jgi:hypothetical protein
MLISALFVGLCLGFSAYHLFVARYILQQGMSIGMQYAAKDLLEFMHSLESNDKAYLEDLMQNFSYNRKLRESLARVRQSKGKE